MKSRFIIPVALGATLTVSGCGDRGPVSPELPQGIEAPLFKTTPAGPAQVEGEIGPGALYALFLPAGWNGDLVLYAHGYSFPDAPIALPGIDALRDGILALGFGVAYSSYSENGFAIKDGLIRTRQLIGLFTSKLGRPRNTYIIGHSLGGMVTLMAAEKNPGLFAGAMPMCSLVGGSRLETDYIGHVRVLFDYFYPGIIPGAPTAPPPDVDFNDLVPAIIGAIFFNPAPAFELAGVDQASIAFIDFPELLTAILTALFFNFEATNDLVERAHGHSVFDNTATVYAGSLDDAALNAGVERIASTPDADNTLKHWYQPDGKLSLPVLTLHTTRDPLVPLFHEPVYAAIVDAAGKSDLLVQRVIDRFGHCTFTLAEQIDAFQDLVNWVENGVKPTP